jgi:hypothetical protein
MERSNKGILPQAVGDCQATYTTEKGGLARRLLNQTYQGKFTIFPFECQAKSLLLNEMTYSDGR